MSSRLATFALWCIAALGLLGQRAIAGDVKVLHTYGNSLGQEVTNVIAVSTAKLLPLLPAGYTIVPADSLGFGGPDQGILAIANFRGFDPSIDGYGTGRSFQLAIDLGILVVEPAEAAKAGLNIAGAFHLYAITIYTNDARYAASLRAEIPVKFVSKIGYQREMNDATGVGDLTVSVPAKNPFFFSLNSGQGYASASGAFNAIFWHDRYMGKGALHFLDQPFRQGTAISQIYTRPHSKLDDLLHGGGLGPCDPDPATGYNCVVAPSLNLRYDEGTHGTLFLIR